MKVCAHSAEATPNLQTLCLGHSSCLQQPWVTAAEFSSSWLTLFVDRSAHLLDTEVAGGTILPIFHLNESIFCKNKTNKQKTRKKGTKAVILEGGSFQDLLMLPVFLSHGFLFSLFFSFLFFPLQPLHLACRILVPDRGSNLCPLWQKCGVLTARPPGKSHRFFQMKIVS